MRVLFLCPHGAAKSVIAASLATALASERRWPISFASRGTESDTQLNPAAVSALESRGHTYLDVPRDVTSEDIGSADLIVSFGVDPAELPAPSNAFLDWSDVPDVTADVDGLIRILEDRIRGLLEGLSL